MKPTVKVWKGKHLPNTFSIQNNLKKEDVLLPLFFSFALEYAIRNVTNRTQTKWHRTASVLC
jgi:hypothetical protein